MSKAEASQLERDVETLMNTMPFKDYRPVKNRYFRMKSKRLRKKALRNPEMYGFRRAVIFEYVNAQVAAPSVWNGAPYVRLEGGER